MNSYNGLPQPDGWPYAYPSAYEKRAVALPIAIGKSMVWVFGIVSRGQAYLIDSTDQAKCFPLITIGNYSPVVLYLYTSDPDYPLIAPLFQQAVSKGSSATTALQAGLCSYPPTFEGKWVSGWAPPPGTTPVPNVLFSGGTYTPSSNACNPGSYPGIPAPTAEYLYFNPPSSPTPSGGSGGGSSLCSPGLCSRYLSVAAGTGMCNLLAGESCTNLGTCVTGGYAEPAVGGYCHPLSQPCPDGTICTPMNLGSVPNQGACSALADKASLYPASYVDGQCIVNTCQLWKCSFNGDGKCPSGYVCAPDVNFGSGGSLCYSNSLASIDQGICSGGAFAGDSIGCLPGQLCTNNQCTSPPGWCYSDPSVCPAGKVCDYNFTTQTGSGMCVTPQTGCAAPGAAACPSGQLCNATTGVCACSGSTTLPNGTVGDSCGGGMQCDASSGMCVPIPPVRCDDPQSPKCPTGTQCNNITGVCTAFGCNASGCGAPGGLCDPISGMCGCNGDSDCSSGGATSGGGGGSAGSASYVCSGPAVGSYKGSCILSPDGGGSGGGGSTPPTPVRCSITQMCPDGSMCDTSTGVCIPSPSNRRDVMWISIATTGVLTMLLGGIVLSKGGDKRWKEFAGITIIGLCVAMMLFAVFTRTSML